MRLESYADSRKEVLDGHDVWNFWLSWEDLRAGNAQKSASVLLSLYSKCVGVLKSIERLSNFQDELRDSAHTVFTEAIINNKDRCAPYAFP